MVAGVIGGADEKTDLVTVGGLKPSELPMLAPSTASDLIGCMSDGADENTLDTVLALPSEKDGSSGKALSEVGEIGDPGLASGAKCTDGALLSIPSAAVIA